MRIFIKVDGILNDLSLKNIDDLFDPEYHKNIEPNQNMIRTCELLKEDHHDVYIMTTKYENKEINNAKKEWFAEHISFLDESNILNYNSVQNKINEHSFNENDVLIDDHLPSLQSFQEKGGKTILVTKDYDAWPHTIQPQGLPGRNQIMIEHLDEKQSQPKDEKILLNEPQAYQNILNKDIRGKTILIQFLNKNLDMNDDIQQRLTSSYPTINNTMSRWQHFTKINLGDVNTSKLKDDLYIISSVSLDKNGQIDNEALKTSLSKIAPHLFKDAKVYVPFHEEKMTSEIKQTLNSIVLKNAENIFSFDHQHTDLQDEFEKIDLSIYNEKQQEQIIQAHKQGLDYKKMLDPNLDSYKMMYIKIGMANKIDMTPYAQDFDSYQMKEILNCLRHKIPVDHFKPEMTTKEMRDYYYLESDYSQDEIDKLKAKADETYKAKKTALYTKEELDEIKSYPILSYAEEIGYTLKQVGRGQYSLVEHDSVSISPQLNLFYRFSNANKGISGHKGSIIDFVMEFQDMDKTEAILYLKDYLKINYQNHSISYQKYKDMIDLDYQPEPVDKITLPEQNMFNDKPNNYKIIQYLTVKRELNESLVKDWINKGYLYQDDHANCVFVNRDENGEPIFANRRGTSDTKTFKQDLPGCNYNHCFYIDNKSDTMIVTEGIIDGMSLLSLRQDYNTHNLLSLSGTSKAHAVFYQLEQHPEIKNVILGLDNDEAGISATKFISDKLKQERPDIDITDMTPIRSKDWNEYIVNLRSDYRNLIKGTKLEKIIQFRDGKFYQKDKRVSVRAVQNALEKINAQQPSFSEERTNDEKIR